MTRRNSFTPLKSGGLLAAAFLAGSFMSSLAGETETKSTSSDGLRSISPTANLISLDDGKDIKETAPPESVNPLSFFDGKVVFDVQERLRWENRSNNFDFNSAVRSPTDGNWFQNRFRIGVTVQPTDWFTFYAQGQSSLEMNGNRGTIPGANAAEGDDYFNLRQAYLEFANYDVCPFGLKIGRQELSYGDERLVGSFDWNNLGRTFDAAKVHYQGEHFWIDAFTSTPAVVYEGRFDTSDLFNGNDNERELVFSGLYFSTDKPAFGTVDLYAFMLDQQNGVASNAEGLLNPTVTTGNINDRSDFVTLGSRIYGDPQKLRGWEYQGEYAYQVGTLRGEALSAFAAHTGVGYNFLDVGWTPRIFVEYNYASGDRNAADGHINTFQNLFPTNHKFYGIMDTVSWQNTDNLGVSLRASPIRSLTAQVDYHAYWLATTNDAWYRANGFTQVRPLSAAAGKDISNYTGSEIDLLLTWQATKNVQFQAGYSHFFAGAYLKETGAYNDANFAYLQTQITF
jgi:hypothetical protein